jgi:hypothetical protein
MHESLNERGHLRFLPKLRETRKSTWLTLASHNPVCEEYLMNWITYMSGTHRAWGLRRDHRSPFVTGPSLLVLQICSSAIPANAKFSRDFFGAKSQFLGTR